MTAKKKRSTAGSGDLVIGRNVHYVSDTGDCLPAIVAMVPVRPGPDDNETEVHLAVIDARDEAKETNYHVKGVAMDSEKGKVGSWHWPQDHDLIESKRETDPTASER